MHCIRPVWKHSFEQIAVVTGPRAYVREAVAMGQITVHVTLACRKCFQGHPLVHAISYEGPATFLAWSQSQHPSAASEDFPEGKKPLFVVKFFDEDG